MFLFISSQHVLAQIGHRQTILLGMEGLTLFLGAMLPIIFHLFTFYTTVVSVTQDTVTVNEGVICEQ
jgi:hypothetical protein